MKRTNLSVVIASFNTKKLLKNCLKLLSKIQSKINLEIIVVDNNSKDGSWQMVKKEFPKVILIKNSRNLFLHKALNQGIKKAKGKFILILNSDTKPQTATIQKSLEFLNSHSQAAAVSCKHVEVSGKVDNTCSRFPTPFVEIIQSSTLFKFAQNSRIIQNYRYSNWSRNSIKKVDVIPASHMLIKSPILKKLTGFDENLKLFYGDVDLCLRIAKLGLYVYHIPQKVIHLRAQSIKKLPAKQLRSIVEHDTFYYYKKQFGIFAALVVWLSMLPNWIYWQIKKDL